MWDAITHPCPNFDGGLAKPPLKLGHGWVITSTVLLAWTHLSVPWGSRSYTAELHWIQVKLQCILSACDHSEFLPFYILACDDPCTAPTMPKCFRKPVLITGRTWTHCMNRTTSLGFIHPIGLDLISLHGLTLSKSFQPLSAQLSMKAALQLAKTLATASYRISNTS